MLVGKTKDEVQDMLGIVNEFMSFIGIPINVKKSKYSYRKRIKPQGKIVTRYDLSDDLLHLKNGKSENKGNIRE